MDKQARLFWTVWIVPFVAVIVGRFVDWLNVGAMAGAIALLIALAATYPRRR
jgi:succinate-acetate transporter protein